LTYDDKQEEAPTGAARRSRTAEEPRT